MASNIPSTNVAGGAGKMKGKTVDLTEISNKPINWAEGTEELSLTSADPEHSGGYAGDDMRSEITAKRSQLPSVPKAALSSTIDVNRVPTTGPFSAYVGNISYDATQEDVVRFFAHLKVLNCRLMRDGSRVRGYGYVEFESRDDLIEALGMTKQRLLNRQVKVDLADRPQEQTRRRRQQDDGGCGSGWGGRQQRGIGYNSANGRDREQETTGDWRMNARANVGPPSPYEDDRRPQQQRPMGPHSRPGQQQCQGYGYQQPPSHGYGPPPYGPPQGYGRRSPDDYGPQYPAARPGGYESDYAGGHGFGGGYEQYPIMDQASYSSQYSGYGSDREGGGGYRSGQQSSSSAGFYGLMRRDRRGGEQMGGDRYHGGEGYGPGPQPNRRRSPNNSYKEYDQSQSDVGGGRRSDGETSLTPDEARAQKARKTLKRRWNAIVADVESSYRPNQELLSAVEGLRFHLEQVVQELYPSAKVIIFGSQRVNARCSKSDVDFCLVMHDQKRNRKNKLVVLRNLRNALRNDATVSNVQIVDRSNAHESPSIITGRHVGLEIDFDICCDDIIGPIMSKAVRLARITGGRIVQSAFIILKAVGKACDVLNSNKGQPSPSALYSMLIYLLQIRDKPIFGRFSLASIFNEEDDGQAESDRILKRRLDEFGGWDRNLKEYEEEARCCNNYPVSYYDSENTEAPEGAHGRSRFPSDPRSVDGCLPIVGDLGGDEEAADNKMLLHEFLIESARFLGNTARISVVNPSFPQPLQPDELRGEDPFQTSGYDSDYGFHVYWPPCISKKFSSTNKDFMDFLYAFDEFATMLDAKGPVFNVIKKSGRGGNRGKQSRLSATARRLEKDGQTEAALAILEEKSARHKMLMERSRLKKLEPGLPSLELQEDRGLATSDKEELEKTSAQVKKRLRRKRGKKGAKCSTSANGDEMN